MGKIEKLSEQLEQWYVEEDGDRFLRGIKKLPAKLRPLGYAAFGFTKDGGSVSGLWSSGDYARRLEDHENWVAVSGAKLDSISLAILEIGAVFYRLLDHSLSSSEKS